MRVAVVCVALVGCEYHPGSFSYSHHHFPGQRASVGCIDIAVERWPNLTDGASVFGYQFGNRCTHPAVVDLASVTVVGITTEGTHVPLAAYDPHDELRALRIDGHRAGDEAISYPSKVEFSQVCVDAASLAHVTPARWMCFDPDRMPTRSAAPTIVVGTTEHS